MPDSALPTLGAEVAPGRSPGGPVVELEHLDALWFQVTGTVCNLRCAHCFIRCAPDNHAFEFLTLEEVLRWLERSEAWGVKEYYVTGGEPFMHRDLPEMLEAMLERGPATVLTNGTLFRERVLARLARAERRSLYSLEIRVSLDGPNPEINDPVRGRGTFRRAMEGVSQLLRHGFLPIVTATRVWDEGEDEAVQGEFIERLRAMGYDRPRLKILPPLRIGREAARTRGYGEDERVTEEMLEEYDRSQLLCSGARIVTSRGVHVCPILIEEPDSRLGSSLEEAARPFRLRHRACYTCWLHGAICSNYGGAGGAAAAPVHSVGRGEGASPSAPGPRGRRPGRWRAVPAASGAGPGGRGPAEGPGPAGRGLPEGAGRRRIAVFGGVYNNYLALEALVADARRRGAEALYCLGDLGGFGPHPDRVFPILVGEGIRTLRGNYDDSIAQDLDDCRCGYTDPRDAHFARLSYEYTSRRTSEQWKRWMAGLPDRIRFRMAGAEILMCHGSPRRVNEFLWESITSTAFLEYLMRRYRADVILATHTGLPWKRTLPDGRVFANVGALGRPANDGRTAVWYALVSEPPPARRPPAGRPRLEVELLPLTYDHRRLAAEMRDEALPEEFVETILTGWWTTCLEVLPARERRRGRF